MLKVAIVGCGKIADAHASQIVRVRGCEIVAVCDREPLMAKQLYERFPVKHWFEDLAELLDKARPDVVHITTPAETHYAIARHCLEQGSHVYVEKPVTLYAAEAEALIRLAEARGLKLTAGHDDQFSHVTRRMRALIQSGYLGGPPVHMESSFCYDLGDPAYARALLADKNHWVRRLPGKLLHNIISHGVARIAEYLTGDSPTVLAHGFVSPLLKSMGETDIIDELRVIISEEQRTTAYFTFSSQMRPTLHEFRIYGPRNGLVLDQDQETLIRVRGDRYKSFAEKFIPPMGLARQHLGNLKTNVGLFLRRDFHMKAGMKCLIESFYRSIEGGGPPPIPYREILATARIMDSIFDQLAPQRPSDDRERPLQQHPANAGVTGR
ncbi:MAG TPA: Gfo/Idh/MocA family oxidoreductase [Hyphomicrobiaceae bacterium]|nr:Gfo/Idh/MocA family oxidoreductase [Hyphomicrobiaceae bacterium]